MSKKKLSILYYTPSFLWLGAGSLLLKKGLTHLIQGFTSFHLSFISCLVMSLASITLGLIKYHLIFKKMVCQQLIKLLKTPCSKEVLKNLFHIKKLLFIMPMIFLSKLTAYLIKEPFYTSPLKIGIGLALVLSGVMYAYTLNKNIYKNS